MINRLILSLLCFFIGFSSQVMAEVRLPKLVSDNMVIQRDTKLKIWGWADAQEKVMLTFKGKKYKATTGADGKWAVWLPATKAGGPYTMEIKGADNSIAVKNILVGDVWYSAGQSNMVHNLGLHE